MASTDAKPIPQKNVAYRITFPILDADGDLVTGATGLDSEVSKDAGTFADCTNEATEIATASGIYYLDLTSTEMNADTVAVIIKTSSSGAKTTTIIMYPEEAGDIRVNVTAYGGTAGTFASGIPEVKVNNIAASAITATSIAADAITDAKVASDVTIASVTGAVGSVTGAVGSVTGNVGGNVTGSVGSVATGGITAASFAADSITAAKLAADVTTELQSGLATSAELAKVPKSDSTVTWNATAAAQIQSEAADALNAYDPPTNAEMVARTITSTDYATTGGLDSLGILFDSMLAMLQGVSLVNGTIGATGNDSTHLHLSGLAYADDAINSMLLTIKDVSTGLFYSRWIEDWVDSTELATVATLPFTPQASYDQYWLTPVRSDVLDTEVAAIKTVVDAIEVDTQDIQSRLGTPSNLGGGASIAANLSDIEAQTDDIGVAGAGLTALATAANLATLTAYVDTEVAAILADTNELQTDWANGGRLDLILDARASQTSVDAVDDFVDTEVAAILAAVDTEVAAIKAKTDQLTFTVANQVDSNALSGGGGLDAAGVRAAVGLSSANLDTQLSTIDTEVGVIDGIVDAILVDTAEIGVAGAGLTALATQASVNTIDDFIDTEVAAIKAKTDLIPASPAAVGDIPSAATIADAVWDETLSGHLGVGSTGEALNAAGAAGDPWTTALPGAYGSGSAGKIIGDNINATISSRASQTSVDTIDGIVDSILVDTAEIGAAGAGLTALASQASVNTIDDLLDTEIAALTSELAKVPKSDGVVTWNATAAAQIQSEANDALVAYDPPTRAEATSDANSILTAVGDVPTNAELATALSTADDATLAAIAALSIPTAATIADAVWDEDATAHQTQGTFGQAIGDPGADTDTIFGLVNTNLDATVGSRASQTSVDDLPTNAELATALGTADDAVLTAIDALPTNAELATALAGADDAVLAAIAALNNLSEANIRTALGMASANFDTQIGDLPTNAELATSQASADDATLAAIAALNNLSQAQAEAAVSAALATYDPPTRTEATADKAEVIAAVDANEAKIDIVDTVVDGIKAKTDPLTFTVANQLDANIQYVNDVAVTGTGESGDEWGPV